MERAMEKWRDGGRRKEEGGEGNGVQAVPAVGVLGNADKSALLVEDSSSRSRRGERRAWRNPVPPRPLPPRIPPRIPPRMTGDPSRLHRWSFFWRSLL